MSYNEEQNEQNGNEENENQQQSSSSRKKGGKLVEYSLIAMGKTKTTFNISRQDDAVSDFLMSQPGAKWRASNGIDITLGAVHCEWKISEDEIRLSGGSAEALKHIDTTAFPETPAEFRNRNNRQYQRNAMRRFDEAMEEFEEEVKEWMGTPVSTSRDSIIRV